VRRAVNAVQVAVVGGAVAAAGDLWVVAMALGALVVGAAVVVMARSARVRVPELGLTVGRETVVSEPHG
jgi:hypothetical protein